MADHAVGGCPLADGGVELRPVLPGICGAEAGMYTVCCGSTAVLPEDKGTSCAVLTPSLPLLEGSGNSPNCGTNNVLDVVITSGTALWVVGISGATAGSVRIGHIRGVPDKVSGSD